MATHLVVHIRPALVGPPSGSRRGAACRAGIAGAAGDCKVNFALGGRRAFMAYRPHAVLAAGGPTLVLQGELSAALLPLAVLVLA